MRSLAPRSRAKLPHPAGTLSPLRRLVLGAAVALAVLLIDLRLGGSDALRSLELQTLDWRFRWRGPLAPGPETVLVVVDDRTVAEVGAWPIPRELIAAAVRRLAAADARVIGLDLLFAEAQRPMPAGIRAMIAELSAALPAGADELRRRARSVLQAVEPDLELALAILEADRVVTPYAFVFDPRQANIAGVPPWIRATAYRIRTLPAAEEPNAVPAPAGLIVPAPQIASAGVSTGHVTLLLEPDGSLRAALPAIAHAGELYPSLPVEILRRHLGLPPDQLAIEGGAVLRLGDRRVPLDPAGRHLVNHYGPQGTLPTYALVDVIRGRVDPAHLAGRIVLLGAAAAGAGDRFTTPFSTGLPGVEFLATAIDNMLHDRSLVRNETTRALDTFAIAGLALATAGLAGRRSPALSLLAIVLVLGSWTVLTQVAFVQAGWWLALLAPATAIMAAGIAVEALRLVEERRRRRVLERQRANLGRYFPPAVVDRLAARDAPRELDRTHEATVMFVDLVGFTSLAETMSPAEAMDLLRGFHATVERIVFAHDGMVDKFMGDGVMACFGVPEPHPAAAADALRAAFDLLAALTAPMPAAAPAAANRRLAVGIGIHRGAVLMGDLGGATQLQFTVVGDAVNVASRLEALTRSAGTALIVSDDVVAAARPHLEPACLERLEPLPDVRLRGREETVMVWRLRAGLGDVGHDPDHPGISRSSDEAPGGDHRRLPQA